MLPPPIFDKVASEEELAPVPEDESEVVLP